MVTANISGNVKKLDVAASYASMTKIVSDVSFEKMMTTSIGSMFTNKNLENSGKVLKVTDVKSMNDDIYSSIDNNANKSKIENIIKESKNAYANKDNEVIEDAMKQIKDVVKEAFGVDDEELEKMLAESGLTLMDLLIPTNLVKFVANYATEGDALKLLTDSKASSLYANLSNAISDIMSDVSEKLNIDYEDVAPMLKNYEVNNDLADVSDLKDEVVVTKNVSKEHTLITNKDENAADKEMADTNKVPLEEKVTITSDNKMEAKSNNDSSESMSHNLVNNLIDNVNEAIAPDNTFTGYVDAENIVRQIVDSIKVNVNSTTQSMELTLTPENLGKVNLLVTSKDGVLTASLTAQNEAVKAAIENQLVALKESFSASGLKVEAVEVTIESHGFEMGRNLDGRNENQSDNQSENQNRRFITIDEINARLESGEELTDEEVLAASMMMANGNSVDYSA